MGNDLNHEEKGCTRLIRKAKAVPTPLLPPIILPIVKIY